jgi:hypothetical protein
VTGKRLEAKLDALREATRDPFAPGAYRQLRAAFESRQNLLVATAADIVAEFELDGFSDALVSAFERFVEQPVKRDPGCRAKTATARALYRTEVPAIETFLRGIRLVQREPVWGGSVDTAVELRAACALGLVRSGYPGAMIELSELLADPEPMARVGAVQALVYSERAEVAVPILRFKALINEPETQKPPASRAAWPIRGSLAFSNQISMSWVEPFAPWMSAELIPTMRYRTPSRFNASRKARSPSLSA